MTLEINGEREAFPWLGMATYLPRITADGYEDSEWHGRVVRHLAGFAFNTLAIPLVALASVAHLVCAGALGIKSACYLGREERTAKVQAKFALQHLKQASLLFPLIPVHLFSALYPPIFAKFENSDAIDNYLHPELSLNSD